MSSSESSVRFLGIAEDGNSYNTTAGDCSIGATCSVGDLTFSGTMVSVPETTIPEQQAVFFHCESGTSFTVSEKVVLASRSHNVQIALQDLTSIESVSAPSVFGGSYVVSNFEYSNVYSPTPFLHYDYSLDGEAKPPQVTVCSGNSCAMPY